jgi:hypothetical protein
MHQYALDNPSANILYLHTKGINYVNNPVMFKRSQDWTKYMLYSLVEADPKACVEMLKGDVKGDVDTIGCNYSEKPTPHYSGNFWWATAKHIRSLPVHKLNDKMSAERWVLQVSCNMKVLHNSNINHFEEEYPRERYEGKIEFSSIFRSTEVDGN